MDSTPNKKQAWNCAYGTGKILPTDSPLAIILIPLPGKRLCSQHKMGPTVECISHSNPTHRVLSHKQSSHIVDSDDRLTSV